VVKNGELVSAAEEERFNRIKQSPRIPPVKSADYCLKAAGVTADEVDYVAFGFDGPSKYLIKTAFAHIKAGEYRHLLHSFPGAIEYAIQLYKLRSELIESHPALASKPWVFVPHHLCHAASSYRVSGFKEAIILTVDGNGENDSGITAIGRGPNIDVVNRRSIAQSLGAYYGNVTQALGFRRHVDEGKVMGLAPYGTDRFGFSGLNISDEAYKFARGYNYKHFWNETTVRRKQGQSITSDHQDFAASAQARLQEAGVALARGAYSRTGLRKICLSGGVALNCDMNAKIMELDFIDELYAQPASHDAGTAIGAAFELSARMGDESGFVMSHAYWGPEYDSNEIGAFLKESGVIFSQRQDIAKDTAKLLHEGNIVGWFQGRLEIGPRALGNRSILANPSIPGMKDRINLKVKHREDWRPFAPSMLAESANQLVFKSEPSPFMLLTFTVRPEWRNALQEATHVDHTVRSQTVTKTANPLYHQLITEFESLSGIPALLNTSFNDAGEPIVMSPRDAIRTFFCTGLDYLAIGDYLVSKRSH